MIHDLCLIGGRRERATGEAEMKIVNPATEESILSIRLAGKEDADRAVIAARAAFPAWSSAAVESRLERLDALRAAFEARKEDFARTISQEMGAPIVFAREHHAGIPAQTMRDTIALARTYPYEREEGGAVIRREAYGVMAAITPWNDPMMLVLIKLVPALAAGCTVVWKPAESTAPSALLLSEVIETSGFPKGVVNIVLGAGSTVGEALARHGEVDMVAFTGSTGAGRRVGALASEHVAKVLLELGGKSASVVLSDANLEAAVTATAKDCFLNSGQFCGAKTRLLVPRARIEEAARIASAYAENLKLGDPLDESVTLGPVASRKQRDKIVDLIRSGIEQGALWRRAEMRRRLT